MDRTAITSTQFAELMPALPLLTSTGRGWEGVELQRYQIPPSTLTMPGTLDHRLAVHLARPTLLEGECDGQSRRGWSESGHINLTPARLPSVIRIEGRPDVLLLHIAPALLDEVRAEAFEHGPADSSLALRLSVPDPTLDQLGRLLLAEAEDGGPGGHLVADGLTRALAVHLLRRYSPSGPQAPNLTVAGELPGWRLRRVVDHMHANMAEDLPLAQLAAVGGLSASQFSRAFRAATGESPYRYLIRIRLKRACDLLEHTMLPVVEVSMRCGFEQPSHFATMFRKFMGTSPRAYRKARCT